MSALLSIIAFLLTGHGHESPHPTPPPLPTLGALAKPLSNEEALGRLPLASKEGISTLPIWARMLAADLPRSTAALLQLDHAQRTKSPLDPKLRAAMRFVSAKANGSDYAATYALADALRAGHDNAALDALQGGDLSTWSEADRNALAFAHKMTVASSAITDDEFATLVKQFGEKKVASMVLLLAYANFQDRLLNCLGATVEDGGPLPPLDVTLPTEEQTGPNTPPPPLRDRKLPSPSGTDEVGDDVEWKSLTYSTLQERLEQQRRRSTRLPIPAWEDVEKNLPPGLLRPTKIVWYQITMGYAPELGVPFQQFMRIAGSEVAPKYDRLFAGAVFWIVTKAIDCPYCMGHCEMNWEVAGLDQDEIAERSRLLAGDDWSSFPQAQQHAFAFARKLTQQPGAIDDDDIATLKNQLGPELALIVALSASRYNYMTRISNGFQLTLESENVFYDYYGIPKPDSASSLK
jgi:alkylhydroperoxidase family enzyme